MAIVSSTNTSSAFRPAKYTQGFVFGHDAINADYARAVVERSCVAVATLLQDVFAVTEKVAFQQASQCESIGDQNRAFRRLAEIVRYRSVIEKSVATAVSCAYVEMINIEVIRKENAIEICKRMSELERLRCEKLDLMTLFAVDGIRDMATDRNRPLLFDLNAQLGLLFGNNAKHIACCPLAPATLMGGFVAGLMCADMDIHAKKLFFAIFEQEFLSKLSVLINSVILRLEQENLVPKRPVGFDEKNAGPISQLLSHSSLLSPSVLQQKIDVMHKTLASHQRFPVGRNLYELSGEDSTDSLIHLLSDVRYYGDRMETPVLRMTVNALETENIMQTRNRIAGQLNTVFSGKKMPVAVLHFLRTLWPDVLFDIYVTAGDSSELWRDAIALQQTLLDSVTPAVDAEKTTMLNHIIPVVVRTLRRLLEETNCRYDDTVAFLGELKSLHLQNVQQKLSVDSFVVWKAIVMDSSMVVAERLLNEDELACYKQMQDMMSLLKSEHAH